jgi:hypothetical protein
MKLCGKKNEKEIKIKAYMLRHPDSYRDRMANKKEE